jgi:hypothetical protein
MYLQLGIIKYIKVIDYVIITILHHLPGRTEGNHTEYLLQRNRHPNVTLLIFLISPEAVTQ